MDVEKMNQLKDMGKLQDYYYNSAPLYNLIGVYQYLIDISNQPYFHYRQLILQGAGGIYSKKWKDLIIMIIIVKQSKNIE